MPRLACSTCGRQIYSVSPLHALDADERRCPRCGAQLQRERRDHDRRETNRRTGAADAPGPPGEERRSADRRVNRRRQ